MTDLLYSKNPLYCLNTDKLKWIRRTKSRSSICLTLLLVMLQLSLCAQNAVEIKGRIVDQKGQPVPFATIVLEPENIGTVADADGNFIISKAPKGRYNLKVKSLGYKEFSKSIDVTNNKPLIFNLSIEEDTAQLDEVVIQGKLSEAQRKEVAGFSIEAIETQKIKSQSLELNNVLGRAPGVRVRKSGGTGSDFNYSLDGMSGNAIRFFIDGIPMDYFGSSYSINNLPIALIDRVDIYKGVVPVELGSDALGGAINLVTNQNIDNYAEVSYSYGSFNTHQTALHGQWRLHSGFTTKLSAFYTYSDNNYKVWGRGVHYADASSGFKAVEFTKENPAERFNDDFKTMSTKVDLGFSQKKWADQFFISVLLSDQKRGIQNGQSMSKVYGERRNNEQVVMPSLTYKKKDIITKGLDINAFAGYSYTKDIVIDTTKNRYDWRGDQIATNPAGGEVGRGGSSLFTLKDKTKIFRFNTTYDLPLNFKLGFNYLYTGTNRTGSDPFAPAYRIPYLEPQEISSHFAGLSLETQQFDDKLRANVFLKKYDFNSLINEVVYTTEYEIVEHSNTISNWGGGFAASYRILPKILFKSSLEQATRLPSPREALGDGVNVNNNPLIEPEQSFNANIGTTLGRYVVGVNQGVKISVNAFYRDITDKIQPTFAGGQEQLLFENLDKISGAGAEAAISYDFDEKLKFSLNGTYLDYRNNLKIDDQGRDNIYFGARLKNDPYLLANAGLEYNIKDLIQKKSKLFVYLQSGYVHRFFLRWPNLGNEDSKDFIPSQLVFDAGAGYTFPSRRVILALDVSNIFNEQVYDNFLLQKPGRAVFFKINYQIQQL